MTNAKHEVISCNSIQIKYKQNALKRYSMTEEAIISSEMAVSYLNRNRNYLNAV